MGRPLRIEFCGALYQVTARGNDQQDIYNDKQDREQFLSYLESAVVRHGAVIHAYCLMNNHYHLLLETPSGNLSHIMQHINGAYTNYFNTRRQRSGHLFQGRYKAVLIEADGYLKELSRTIHLNPVTAGLCARPEDYRWSSYPAYIGDKKAPEWLTTARTLGYFKAGKNVRHKYRKFAENLTGKGAMNPQNGAPAATILGSEEFVRTIITGHLDRKPGDRDIPALKKLTHRPSIEAIIQAVQGAMKDGKTARKAGIYVCHTYSGATLKVIGSRFGIGESAVSQASRRLSETMTEDKEVRRLIKKVIERLGLTRVKG